MDYQSYINCIEYPAAVLSVQKAPDGSCGAIHIVCANKLYKEAMGPAYYDGMPYYELVPQDVKFEDFCFRAAIGKQKMQAYVQTPALHTWTDMTLFPLAGDNVIVYAAEIGKEIYGTEELYRPGGDEFLVIMKGKSKEVFDRKLQALMERRERDPQFNIAIGHSWTVEGERELAEAFLIADRGMYQDKKEYYQRFPEKDRRLNKT